MRMIAHQLRYTNIAFWRNPAAATFTFAFPLLFLVVFTTLLGDDEVRLEVGTISTATYYVFSMAAFGLITACFTNIAMAVVAAREEGILKRVRGTPMPASSYLAARVAHAVLVGLSLVAITVAFGAIAYDASVPVGVDLLRFVVTIVVGSVCFAALGLAVTGAIPNAEAAPAIVNAIVFPLLFLSGVFVAIGEDAPAWVLWAGRVFPVRHLVDAMRASYLGLPFRWSDVGALVVWLAIGVVVASRTFRWEARR
jgi:ABC-2 type transport system permease protein